MKTVIVTVIVSETSMYYTPQRDLCFLSFRMIPAAGGDGWAGDRQTDTSTVCTVLLARSWSWALLTGSTTLVAPQLAGSIEVCPPPGSKRSLAGTIWTLSVPGPNSISFGPIMVFSTSF